MAFLAPALGAIGEAAGTAGSAIGSAASGAGSALGGALESAVPGLTNIMQGIGAAGAPSEAARLASLGQAVPEGVELAGPSSTFTGPGFMQSFAQGFLGAPQAALANPSAATSVGGGLGQLFGAIEQMRGGGLPGMPQPQMGLRNIVGLANRVLQGPEMAPAGTLPPKQPGPIMSALAGLFQGF